MILTHLLFCVKHFTSRIQMHFFTKTKFLTSEPHRLSERVERSSGEMIVTMWGPCRSDSVAHDRLWKALYENKFVQKRLS